MTGEAETVGTPPSGADPCLQTRRFFTNLTVQRGRAEIATHGDVDLASRDALSEVAVDALGQPSIHEVVLDLGSVTFLDASGLGCLVTIRNASVQLDRTLMLCNVPARIAWLLELTDLLRHFAVETLTVPHEPQSPVPIQRDGARQGFEPAHPGTSAISASARTHEVQPGEATMASSTPEENPAASRSAKGDSAQHTNHDPRATRDPRATMHPTAEKQAAENADNEPAG